MTPKGKPKLTQRPPDVYELERLQVRARSRDGRIRQYRDPITGNTFSARQVAKARAGGLNHEQIAELRERGQADLVKHARNARGSNSLPYLAERYADKNGIKVSKALRNRDFLDAVDMLRKNPDSKSAKGPKARALVKLGLRSWKDTHRVGNSPKRRNKR